MTNVIQPFHLVIVALACRLNRQQAAVIDYLMEENRVLKEQLEVRPPRGLVAYYMLFVIHLSTRFVHIAGVTTAPNGAFMKQVARNLTDVGDGFLSDKAYLIMDRDAKYTDGFRDFLDRLILLGEASLRRALREYGAHYHSERNHQGVGNRLLEPPGKVASINDPIHCRERLGGMLNFYYREAA